MQNHEEQLGESLALAWNKKPVVLKGVLKTPVFNPSDLFAGLLGTADAMAKGLSAPRGRVGLGGREAATHEVMAFLPTHAVASFEDYANQLEQIFPGQDYSIILNKIDASLPGVRNRITPILHSLFARVGYPVRGIDSCIYAGNYRSTPFGIHVDDCHVLMACGIGRKKMAFWPRDYFEGRQDLFVPGAHGYLHCPADEYLKDAEILEIGQDDLLYWPAGWWHVGISDSADFHAALSVGIYHRGSLNAVLRRSLPLPSVMPPNAGLDAFDALDVDGYPQPKAETDWKVPGSFLDLWSNVRDAFDAAGGAEAAFLRQALAEVTSAGFGAFPAVHSASSAPDQLYCDDPRSLVWVRVRERVVIGANGLTIDASDQGGRLESLLGELKSGVRVSAANVLQHVPSSEHVRWNQFFANARLAC